MSKIVVKININRDAWNWWDACNKVSFGVDWSERIPSAIRNKIKGKTREEAFAFLIPYLKKLYIKEKIKTKQNDTKKIFLKSEPSIFNRMRKMTGRKIYKNVFTCYVATFPRAPYDFKKGFAWIPVIWPPETYVRTFVHELLHFQTYAYWKKSCLKHITEKQFEYLKEALTLILNEAFIDLIVWQDKGYKQHQRLRKKLFVFWNRTKNFENLIEYGIKLQTGVKMKRR